MAIFEPQNAKMDGGNQIMDSKMWNLCTEQCGSHMCMRGFYKQVNIYCLVHTLKIIQMYLYILLLCKCEGYANTYTCIVFIYITSYTKEDVLAGLITLPAFACAHILKQFLAGSVW